ncbi:SDR family oxidoreductase [Streptomyces scopuliridis]
MGGTADRRRGADRAVRLSVGGPDSTDPAQLRGAIKDAADGLVQPGPTDTDANPANGPPADRLRDITPLGRYARLDDMAATIAHLAGDGGRRISGTTITIDGGLNT